MPCETFCYAAATKLPQVASAYAGLNSYPPPRAFAIHHRRLATWRSCTRSPFDAIRYSSPRASIVAIRVGQAHCDSEAALSLNDFRYFVPTEHRRHQPLDIGNIQAIAVQFRSIDIGAKLGPHGAVFLNFRCTTHRKDEFDRPRSQLIENIQIWTEDLQPDRRGYRSRLHPSASPLAE